MGVLAVLFLYARAIGKYCRYCRYSIALLLLPFLAATPRLTGIATAGKVLQRLAARCCRDGRRTMLRCCIGKVIAAPTRSPFSRQSSSGAWQT